MLAARRLLAAPALLGLVLLCAVALVAPGCTGRRGASCGCEAKCGCEAAPACSPCAAAEPCSPCGPRPAAAQCGEAWCCVYVPPVEGEQCYQVLVCPAKERCVYVPPTFGTHPKLVCKSPAALTETVQPAVWVQHERDVLLKGPHETIRPICCPPGNLAPGERQCGCLTKCCHPPVWGKECERICLECERTCVGFKPAEYQCVEETYQLSPGFTQKVCEPAVYETRTRKVCLQPGRWEWRKNELCKPPQELFALQLEMVDSAPDGKPAGVFHVGSQARFDLTVTAEVGSAPMKGLQVVFTLPPEYEFASGSSPDGVTISGGGQSAVSSTFDLSVEHQVRMYVLVNVKSSPKSQTAKFNAVVKDSAGMDLAVETEESTIPTPQ